MRVSGIVFVAPPFGASSVPPLIRGLVALVLTLVLLPAIPLHAMDNAWRFGVAALGELVIGLAIGLLALLLILAVQGAGDLLDLEMGFAVANVIDPHFERPVPLMGSFLYFFALTLFLVIDGHLLVIRALFDSFQRIPPGAASWDGSLFHSIVEQFAWVIITAIQVSLPIIGVLFMATAALGVLARTMPQLNVFLVGMPLKIALGLAALGLMLPILVRVFVSGFDTSFNYVARFIQALVGGS